MIPYPRLCLFLPPVVETGIGVPVLSPSGNLSTVGGTRNAGLSVCGTRKFGLSINQTINI